MARIRKNVSMIDSPDKEQSDVWDFPVHQEELLTSSGVKSGIHAVIRGDTGGVIGQYKGEKVLPYPQLVETFENALTGGGYAFNRQIITTGNGGRMFARFDIGNGLHASGEAFNQIIRLQSSHDGKLTPGFSFEAQRLACLNGMMGMAELFAIFRKHSTNFDIGFLTRNIKQAIDSGCIEIQATVERMGNIPIDNGQARNILSNIVSLGSLKGVSPRAGYLINNNWENPTEDEKPLGDTLYRLYNSATRFCRDVENVGRFELSRRANLYITGAFDLAARRSTDLEKLLAEPTTSLDFDGVTVNN